MGEAWTLWLFLSHYQERQHPTSEVADLDFLIPLSVITVSHKVMHKRPRALSMGHRVRRDGDLRFWIADLRYEMWDMGYEISDWGFFSWQLPADGTG